MISDTELKVKGMKILTEAMGPVAAERFINAIMREPFDYTEWQRQLWPGKTVGELSKMAMKGRRVQRTRRK